jgi:hypothetical protein
MEDVLDLYEAPYDPARPVVCFDESPKQLIVEVRQPIPVEPGAPARYDTGYERKGVCDLMMICEPKQGFRHVDVTDRRTKIDFAHSMKHVAELYPEASVIRVVLDNLNTHKVASLVKAFPAEQARTLARKAGVPLHPQARQLVEHRRNRIGCLVEHVPVAADTGQRASTP